MNKDDQQNRTIEHRNRMDNETVSLAKVI